MRSPFSSLWIVLFLLGVAGPIASAAETKIELKFSGGHETDRRDGGRPVVLVAAALGIKPELFREAFSGVTPARNGPPTAAEARRNKEALLNVLGPHGITNERLDEVSDFYRYQPQRGELWRTKPAKAHAIVDGGHVKSVVVTEPGAGYSSAPTATIPGLESARLQVNLAFGTDLTKNGSIAAIKLEPPATPEAK